jgi:hypothetical protein
MPQVASHKSRDFPSENARDAYASRTAWLGVRVTLPFLLSNFSNREQQLTYLSWSESSLTIHVGLNNLAI